MRPVKPLNALSRLLFSLLILMMSACGNRPEARGLVGARLPVLAAPALTWETYTNETWKFTLTYPTSWKAWATAADSGYFGRQVFWAAASYDPLELRGDAPAVDELTDVTVAGQPARRAMGHYLGAIGDMGYQQYLRYVIPRGEIFFMFTLCAVDTLGLPPDRLTEQLPLQDADVALFEQMMASLIFNP